MRDWDSVNIIRDEGEQREFMSEKIRRILVRRSTFAARCLEKPQLHLLDCTGLHLQNLIHLIGQPWVNSLASVDFTYQATKFPNLKIINVHHQKCGSKC